jgi:hypothetical protein
LTQFQDPTFKIANCTVDHWRHVGLLVRSSIPGDGLMKAKRTGFQGFPDSKLMLVRPHAPVEFFGTFSDRIEEVDGALGTNGCTTLLKCLVVSVFLVDGAAVDVCHSLSGCKQVGLVAIVAMVNRFLIAVRRCNFLKFPVVPKVTQLLVISRVQQALNGVIDYFAGNFTRQVKPSTSCWRSEQCFTG